MQTVIQEETLEARTREFCQFVLDSPEFSEAQKKIEAFMGDDGARSAYSKLQEKGQELHGMQNGGREPGDADIEAFDQLKQTVLSNPVAADFLQAEDYMNGIFSTVTKHLEKTLQLGRVPTDEDFEESGCCGGGCGYH